MTTINQTGCYLVLACTDGEVYILKKCSVWDENDPYVGEIITECYGPLHHNDWSVPVPGTVGQRVVRPDWAQVAREKIIPNQSKRARENMPVYVEWARKEHWDIWASEP